MRLAKLGKISALLAVVMAVVMLAGCSLQSDDEKKDTRPVIVVGSDDYPPFNFRNEDGVPTGIDVDLAKEAFGRMGYQVEVRTIEWARKTELVDSGEIDCIMGCFSMAGRLDQYNWAGPYMVSRQVVAVPTNSKIYTLQDLEGHTLASQSTAKPEEIYTKHNNGILPKLGNFLSLENRALVYTFMGKGYADAVAAHETAIVQYMRDYDVEFRIINQPLMVVGIGVAFSKNDKRGLSEELERTLDEMRQDGTSARIIGKYLNNPEKYLEVDRLDY